MMDFIDKIMAKNLEGGLSDQVKVRPRARFETSDGMAGIERPQEVENSPEQPNPNFPKHSTGETRNTRSQIQLPDLYPQNEQQTFAIHSVQQNLSSNDITSKYSDTSSTTVIETLIQSVNKTSETESGLSIRIDPRVEVHENTIIKPLTASEIDLERQPAIERMIDPKPVLFKMLDESPVLPRIAKKTVVNVAIGRIEVHIPPSQQTQQSTTTKRQSTSKSIQPVRSLDDYLHQRNGRKS